MLGEPRDGTEGREGARDEAVLPGGEVSEGEPGGHGAAAEVGPDTGGAPAVEVPVYGLHASASSALVLEVLRAGVASYGTPEEILTDNGSQYVTWRGKSAFTKECEKRGTRQIVARPRRPQTLGKIERFWGTMWRECVEASVFLDLGDARCRIGLFIDHHNSQRVHQGIGGLVPADHFFGAAPEVLNTLKERVAANALDIARNGVPKEPFYLAGNVGGKPVSVYAEGERLLVKQGDDEAREIALASPGDPPAGGEPERAEFPEGG